MTFASGLGLAKRQQAQTAATGAGSAETAITQNFRSSRALRNKLIKNTRQLSLETNLMLRAAGARRLVFKQKTSPVNCLVYLGSGTQWAL
jgi:hypothetical protein